MVSLEVDGLTKTFSSVFGEDVLAVDDISLQVEDGEFVTLVGPSGCGKTTTLRCIAGLEDPTTGAIRFGQENVTNQPPQERNIAMLFQDIALWGHMTVRENIAYGLRIRDFERDEIRRRIDEVARDLHIDDKLDQKPAQLSGGQQQRVALARSITQDPNLFLFDEPLSALDAALKQEIRPLIHQIVKDVGVPAVYVTHDQEEAMTLSDKVAVMNEGRIEQFDTPLNIYRNPANRFVAEFIGTPPMNFVDVGFEAVNGHSTAKVHGIEITAPSDVSDPTEIGIRPQNLRVSADGDVGIPGTHLFDEPLGDRTQSYFETEYGEMIATTGPEFSGDQADYRLVFEPDSAYVF